MKTNAVPKKTKLSDQVFENLRRMVLENDLKVGNYYLEQELAEQLGASRTPLREAAIRLEQEGLVEIIPRRGIFIRPVSAEEMNEIYELLSWLETAAISSACDNTISDEQIGKLEQVHNNMTQALSSNDLDAWAKNDRRFHQILVELSNNRELVRLVNAYWDKTDRVRMLTLRLREPPAQSTKEHYEVIEALKAQNADDAIKLNTSHRKRAAEELTNLLHVLNG